MGNHLIIWNLIYILINYRRQKTESDLPSKIHLGSSKISAALFPDFNMDVVVEFVIIFCQLFPCLNIP